MLVKAYSPYLDREMECEIYHFLTWLKRGNDDYGLSNIWGDLLNIFPQMIGELLHVEVSSFYNSDPDAIINALLPALQQGIPVILSWYAHSVLVLDYRQSTNQTGNYPYDFLIHDPKANYTAPLNDKDQGMYAWVSWQWLSTKGSPLIPGLYLFWINKPEPHPQRTLQTIGLPTGHFKSWDKDSINVSTSSWIKFVISNDSYIKLVWMPDPPEGKGYGWMQYTKWRAPVDLVEAIPLDAYQLDMQLPLWNANIQNDVTVKLKGQIFHGYEKIPVFTWEDNISIPNNLKELPYDKQVDLIKVRQVGLPIYKLSVKIEDLNGIYLDGWVVEFTMSHPYIDMVAPRKISKGTKIEITGIGFGAQQKTKSTSANVMINNRKADVIKWTETSIIAQAPDVEPKGNVSIEIEVSPPGSSIYKLTSNAFPYSSNQDKEMLLNIVVPPGWEQRGSMKALLVPLGDPRGDNFGIASEVNGTIFNELRTDENLLLKNSSLLFTGEVIHLTQTSSPLKFYKDLNDYVNRYNMSQPMMQLIQLMNPPGKEVSLYSAKGNFAIANMTGYMLKASKQIQDDGYWRYVYNSSIFLACADASLHISVAVSVIDDVNVRYQGLPHNNEARAEFDSRVSFAEQLLSSLNITFSEH
jgi:hypothetical protein